MKALIIFFTVLAILPGCAHVISGKVLDSVDASVTFGRLLDDPDGCSGRMVLLGGVIVSTTNRHDGTLLEIYQTELSGRGKPIKRDRSRGRFRAFTTEFLESAIYSQGRVVTIAGQACGVSSGQLDERPYLYPLIEIRELYLWPLERVRVYVPHYDPFWYPCWPSRYHPWYPHYAPYPASRSRPHDVPGTPQS